MDAQSDRCETSPCDPQPPGKIRKALKLFSKRKPGSGVASIFSVRVKGEAERKSPPSRSKTLDELSETLAPEAEAESVDLEPDNSHAEDAALDQMTGKKNNLESTSSRQSISSLTSAKSLSFLSMLRWNRKGGGGEREAQTESHRPGHQRKGLKGLFGSVHWNRKDKEEENEVLPGPPLLVSRSNSVEIMKENLTLTPMPARHFTPESEVEQQAPPSSDDHVTHDGNIKVSGAAKSSTNDRLSTLLGDITSILSLDALAGDGDIIADVEAEWVKVSNRVEIEAGTDDAVNKEKALLALNPVLSSAPTLSSTSPSIPSSTTTKQTISTSAQPKPVPSSPTKHLSPPSTPSLTASPKSIASHINLTTKPDPSPILSPDSSPIQSPKTIPAPIKCPPSTPTLTITTKPTLTDTSPLTPEPSPKPSPTLFPAPSNTTISKTIMSLPEKATDPGAICALLNEPTYTPCPTTKPTPSAAPISERPNHSINQDPKHSSAPVTKYPPFITSTKPVPNAPVIRPKIVTTFGLSSSRNTAPISKPESKQYAQQIKPYSFQPKTEKNGSGSVVPKASPGEPGVDKHLFATNSQSAHASSSATFENPPHKPEPVHTLIHSGASLLPTSLTRPTPNYGLRGKGQEDVSSPRVVEDLQPVSSYKPEKKALLIKPVTLSKIPVSGGGKSKQHHKDPPSTTQSKCEERQWNPPTPVHEEEMLISLSRDSSKDALSDLSCESEVHTPNISYSSEDTLDSAARPTIGTVSIPRESKIPIKPGSTATYHSLQGKTEAARSKIPVSKVPGRRTNSKTGSSSTDATTRK